MAPAGDVQMAAAAAAGTSMEALKAGALRREAEYVSKKRARIADAPQGSAVGEQQCCHNRPFARPQPILDGPGWNCNPENANSADEGQFRQVGTVSFGQDPAQGWGLPKCVTALVSSNSTVHMGSL